MATKWEDLRDASFRGAPFFFRDVEGTGGRRAIPPASPKKEVGWTEDHGAVLTQQQINAILHGSDYTDQLNRLLKLQRPANNRRGKCANRQPANKVGMHTCLAQMLSPNHAAYQQAQLYLARCTQSLGTVESQHILPQRCAGLLNKACGQ